MTEGVFDMFTHNVVCFLNQCALLLKPCYRRRREWWLVNIPMDLTCENFDPYSCYSVHTCTPKMTEATTGKLSTRPGTCTLYMYMYTKEQCYYTSHVSIEVDSEWDSYLYMSVWGCVGAKSHDSSSKVSMDGHWRKILPLWECVGDELCHEI